MQKDEARKMASLFRQIQFLNLRLLAYEQIVSKPWVAMRGLFQPQWLWQKVDKLQMQFIKEHDEEVAKAIEVQKQPKIDIIGANGIIKP